ncbi:MAG: ribbon-helix-helix protein, CopG family [Geminicoccaceae bacterium]
MKRKSVSLTMPQMADVEREAKRLGISDNELIRRIIDEWRVKMNGEWIEEGDG